jgi:hypothetical protein
MFGTRYSEVEHQQWDDACCTSMPHAFDATRQNGARGAVAKGQGESMTASPSADTAAMQNNFATHDDWATECLFDCYNS